MASEMTASEMRTPFPLDAATICVAFQATVAAAGERLALRSPDDGFRMTWTEYGAAVRDVAAGLASLGVADGDAVAILLTNRPEFHIVDLAVCHLGATPFSVYHTNPAAQIAPQLANSGARVLVTEPGFLERAREVRRIHPELREIVVIDGDPAATEMTYDTLVDRGRAASDFDFEAAWRAVTPDHVATLVYTSGTTGAPKGVEHTHGGLMFGLQCMQRLAPVTPGGRVVSFLPMAHIAERFISHYGAVGFGYTITACADPKALPAALLSARPTRLFAVPRIYEKLRGALLPVIEGDPDGPAGRAFAEGLARVRAEQAGETPAPLSDEAATVLAGLREKIGLDRLEWVSVAAAPTPYVVLEFFHAIGVPIAELWGMSECVLSTANPPAGPIKLGTVGIAIPGVEIRLADDGEILVRGPNVFRQYRKDPEQTRQALDSDGWLHSGDVAVADEDGYLRIVDRKKELIINSAGKNMSPAHIENTVKEESPLIAQVVAIGDGRLYVTALVVLDEEEAGRFAASRGLTPEITELADHPDVVSVIGEAVARANERLPRVEQIKTHRILPTVWQPGGDEVTPTMKLKRRVIAEKYASEIDALYATAATA